MVKSLLCIDYVPLRIIWIQAVSSHAGYNQPPLMNIEQDIGNIPEWNIEVEFSMSTMAQGETEFGEVVMLQ